MHHIINEHNNRVDRNRRQPTIQLIISFLSGIITGMTIGAYIIELTLLK